MAGKVVHIYYLVLQRKKFAHPRLNKVREVSLLQDFLGTFKGCCRAKRLFTQGLPKLNRW